MRSNWGAEQNHNLFGFALKKGFLDGSVCPKGGKNGGAKPALGVATGQRWWQLGRRESGDGGQAQDTLWARRGHNPLATAVWVGKDGSDRILTWAPRCVALLLSEIGEECVFWRREGEVMTSNFDRPVTHFEGSFEEHLRDVSVEIAMGLEIT